MEIERVINYTGGGVRANLKWSRDDKVGEEGERVEVTDYSYSYRLYSFFFLLQSILFASNNTVVVMEAPVLPIAVAQDDGSGISSALPTQETKSNLPHTNTHAIPLLNRPVKQKFLFGHTDVVIALEVSHNGLLIATGQKVRNAGSVCRTSQSPGQ